MTIVYKEIGADGYTAIDVDKIYYVLDYKNFKIAIRIGESIVVADSLCINGIDAWYCPDVRVRVVKD